MSAAAFPPPPPYYRLYASGSDVVKEESDKISPVPSSQRPSPPLPPPPPTDGSFILFGAPYQVEQSLPTLEEAGVRQLYPKTSKLDVKSELRSLSTELGLMLLELIDTCVQRPSQYARRVEDISLLLKNIHHLLNSLRPHQARATLIHVLELQLQMRKEALLDLRQRRLGAAAVLEAAHAEASLIISQNTTLSTSPEKSQHSCLL